MVATTAARASSLGKYQLLARVGRGGMADVFLAHASAGAGMDKLVVVKVIRAELAEDDQFVEMFMNEARLSLRLNHPNIVQTFDVVRESGHSFLVMEYIEGSSLAHVRRVARAAPPGLPLELELRILGDVLAGLHHAHELRDHDGAPLHLVHRDVSPQNVVISYDGQVKVLDFGVAKASTTASSTRAGSIKGKVRYMSPEQVLGVPVDRRADVFAVGLLFWETLTKQRVWGDLDEVAIIAKLVGTFEIPAPVTLRPDVDPQLSAICMRALAPKPDDRYPTAAAMLDDLDELLAARMPGATNRALARFMQATFAEQRTKFQTFIAERLGAGGASAAVPLETWTEARPSLGGRTMPAVPASMLTSSAPPPPAPPLLDATEPPSLESLYSASRARIEVVSPVAVPAKSSGAGRAIALLLVLILVAISVGAFAVIVMPRLRARAEPARVDAPPAVTELPPPATPTSTWPAVTATDSVAATTSTSTSTPTPAPTASASASATTAPAPTHKKKHTATDCSSPYYVDERGVTKIKPECL